MQFIVTAFVKKQVIKSNYTINMEYPNRPSRQFLFEEEEFESYVDTETFWRYENDSEKIYTTDEEVKKDFFENFIDNFNKYSKCNSGCNLKIIGETGDESMSDISMDRLDLAIYFFNNKNALLKIQEELCRDKSFGGYVSLDTVKQINQNRKKKQDYIQSLSELTMNTVEKKFEEIGISDQIVYKGRR